MLELLPTNADEQELSSRRIERGGWNRPNWEGVAGSFILEEHLRMLVDGEAVINLIVGNMVATDLGPLVSKVMN